MNTQGNDTYTGNAVFDDGMQGGLVETGETIAGQQGGDALVNENAVPGHNEPPPTPEEMRKDFFKDVNKFGKESGVGSSALARLGLRCVRAAADGLISIEKPTKGGKDDATVIYEAYTASDSKHAEHTAGGSKANASKLRQLIALGCMTTCDGVEVASNTVRLREEMEGQELKPKALFAGLVDVARAQLEVDSALSDDTIKEALTKTTADKTLEKEWKAVAKKIEGLVTGENAAKLKDQSPEAVQIQELVSAYVVKFDVDNSDKELVKAMIAKGYTEAQAEEMVYGKK